MESINTQEIQRLALVLGAIVAVKYKNMYGVTPGGVIVPGVLIVLFLISPIWCFSVIGLSFFIYWLYQRFLTKANYKRRTPMYVLAALSLGIAHPLSVAYSELGLMTPTLDSFSGALIPAIIAFTWEGSYWGAMREGFIQFFQ